MQHILTTRKNGTQSIEYFHSTAPPSERRACSGRHFRGVSALLHVSQGKFRTPPGSSVQPAAPPSSSGTSIQGRLTTDQSSDKSGDFRRVTRGPQLAHNVTGIRFFCHHRREVRGRSGGPCASWLIGWKTPIKMVICLIVTILVLSAEKDFLGGETPNDESVLLGQHL